MNTCRIQPLPIFWASIGALAAYAQGPATVTVSSGRPLMAMLDKLQAITGVPINYEDPRFQHPNDVEDVTDAVVRNKQQALGRVLVPKGGNLGVGLESSLLSPGLSNVSVLSLLTQVRIAYEATGHPGTFNISQRSSAWYVEPSSIRNVNGNVEPSAPIMTTAVQFPSQQGSAAGLLQLILSRVAHATGFQIGVGSAPAGVLASTTVTLAANNEPAWAVLARLFAQLSPPGQYGSPWVYKLLFDPGFKYYVLNVQVVEGASASSGTGGGLSTAPSQQAPTALKGASTVKK